MDLLKVDSEISPQAWGIRPNPYADRLVVDRCSARFAAGCVVEGSMISAGCIIEGEVINSVLSPGVRVGKNARVRDSIILHDCVLEEGAVVDLAILDKRVRVGQGAVVGQGEDKTTPNKACPKHLYTGLTMIGKEAEVPPQAVIGRNCVVSPSRQGADFPALVVATGETV
jgi:glucose-1-phosphate adenylyltransferase